MRAQEPIGEALMVSLAVIMTKVFAHGGAQWPLAKEDHPVQAFGLRCAILMPFQNASELVSEVDPKNWTTE